MHDIASVVYMDYLNEHGKVVEVFLSKDGYNPCLRLFYILNLWCNNDYLEKNGFNSTEVRALEMLCKSDQDFFLEELLEFEWEATRIELSLKDKTNYLLAS